MSESVPHTLITFASSVEAVQSVPVGLPQAMDRYPGKQTKLRRIRWHNQEKGID